MKLTQRIVISARLEFQSLAFMLTVGILMFAGLVSYPAFGEEPPVVQNANNMEQPIRNATVLFVHGIQLDKMTEKTLKWCRKAAEQGRGLTGNRHSFYTLNIR